MNSENAGSALSNSLRSLFLTVKWDFFFPPVQRYNYSDGPQKLCGGGKQKDMRRVAEKKW